MKELVDAQERRLQALCGGADCEKILEQLQWRGKNLIGGLGMIASSTSEDMALIKKAMGLKPQKPITDW